VDSRQRSRERWHLGDGPGTVAILDERAPQKEFQHKGSKGLLEEGVGPRLNQG
jgi:hypothetical protein